MINLNYLENMIKMRRFHLLKGASKNIGMKLKGYCFIFATSAVRFTAGFSFPEYRKIKQFPIGIMFMECYPGS